MGESGWISESSFWDNVRNGDPLQRYQSLLNTAGVGIFQLDAEGRFVGANDAFVDRTGYARDTLLDEHVSVVLTDESVDRVERAVSDHLDAGATELESLELPLVTADGRRLQHELSADLLVADGALQGTIWVARERSDDDGSESSSTPPDSITTVLDEADIGVFVLDEEFEVAWLDETVSTYFGLERDAVIGRDKRQLIEDSIKYRFADPDQFAETVLATYDDNSYIERFECQVVAGGDRDERWLEHYSKPIESGQYEGGRIELYYDVTDRKRSEGALLESQQRFHSLVDAVEEYAIFRLDEDGYVTSWNDGARAIKGYEREEIVGQHFSTFYTDEDDSANVPARNLEAAVETGSVEDEGWRVRKDGSQFYATVTITPVYDDDGTHQGFLKVTRDTTDQYERERELEGELERIFGRISDGFYALDEGLQFTHVNERAERILGVDEDELLGTNVWTAFPELEDTAFEDRYREAMTTQESVAFEEYYPPTDAWYEVHAYPSETGLSVYFRDVSDRIERERELERMERRFESTFQDPNILVGLLEPDGTVRDINQTAMEYIDADLADVIGKPFWETPWWGQGDGVQSDVKAWTERAAAGEYVDFEADLTRPDGDRYTLSGYFRPVTDDDGEVVSIVVSDRDITERKRRERELERSERRYRTLVEYFPDGIVTLFDHDLEYELAAGGGFDRLSIDSDAVEGRHFRDVWGEEATDKLAPAFQAALQGDERSIDLEYDGREWTLQAVPITDERGEVFAGMTVARDITERKARERRLERRATQQQVVADLGQFALETDDIDALMQEAASQVADVLDTEYCKVLDLDDERDELLLREGVGWQDGIVGDASVSAVDAASQAAYTLANDHPIVVEDLETETRFSGPDLLTSHDVRSGISTVIGSFDDPWGILGTHDTEGRTFAAQDVTFVQNVANVLAEAIERVEKERRLRERTSQLNVATDAASIGLWNWHIRDDVVTADEYLAETYGMESESVTNGAPMDDFYEPIHPADGERARTHLERAVEETGELKVEYRVRDASGDLRWVEARGEVEYTETGDPIRLHGAIADITDRKEREHELERALDLLNKTERIADVAGWEVDPETGDPYWSDNLFDLLDVDFDHQPSLDEALDVYHTDADRTTVENAIEDALDTGEPFEVEVQFPRPGGDVGWLRIQGDPTVEDGAVVSLRGAVQDVTEQLERERQLEDLIDRLEESNERLEQFAYAASHDLQEPLRMVSSYLQLIERRYEDALDEEGMEFLAFAVDGANRMREMIDGLLEYSRVETRGDPFEPVDLEVVLEDVRDDLRLTIDESNAQITVDELPTVAGDATQLRQVFLNLLDNAIEYSGDEPPRIDVTATTDGSECLVSVRDEGIGIDPDDADRVFEVFERLHAYDEHSGTGIGLALCERIVERHGGEIWLESEPGQGTTVSFTLPLARDDESDEQ